MGMAAYLNSLCQLGLDEYQLFNAQGNSFDRVAVALPLRGAVTGWACGEDVPRHTYLQPADVLRTYEPLRAVAVRAGLAACPSPFPRDLHDILLHGAGTSARSSTCHLAAEDGRGGC